MRAALATILALLLGAACAAPAQARLVYVKRAETAAPLVYTADDDGKARRLIGVGRSPTVSPDGAWVAYVTVPRTSEDLEELILVPVDGGARRLLMRSRSITDVRFSPASTHVAAIVRERRVRIYSLVEDRTFDAARGFLRGYSFAPDGRALAFGVATGVAVGAASDVYVVPLDLSVERRRVTTTGDALNPVWGPREIVYDRQRRRRGRPPAYDLWATDALGNTTPRRLTSLTIPSLVSGLVPLEFSADGQRLLAVFTGQDVSVGFTVNPFTGRTRALSRDFETGLVGFDLSADGRSILAHTGGPDPSQPHDVVVARYGDGRTTMLVEDAAFPDWSR